MQKRLKSVAENKQRQIVAEEMIEYMKGQINEIETKSKNTKQTNYNYSMKEIQYRLLQGTVKKPMAKSMTKSFAKCLKD